MAIFLHSLLECPNCCNFGGKCSINDLQSADYRPVFLSINACFCVNAQKMLSAQKPASCNMASGGSVESEFFRKQRPIYEITKALGNTETFVTGGR